MDERVFQQPANSLTNRAVAMVALAVPALALVLMGACGGTSTPTSQPAAPAQETAFTALPPGVEAAIATTSIYRVEIWTGPESTLMSAFPNMSIVDQGQRVNHHLEVHIYDKSSGAIVLDVEPTVMITEKTTGDSRVLAMDQQTASSLGIAFVTACKLAEHRANDPHFGDNVYLPDGTYTIAVAVGGETAVAEDVVISAQS